MKKSIFSKKLITSLIVLIIALCGLVGYKAYVNSKAISGIKEYTLIVTDTEGTFTDKLTFKTNETSLGDDLDKQGIIQFEKSSYGRFVTAVNGRKADASKQEWWNLIINEKPSTMGIDDVMINDKDEVKFVLTKGW